MDRHVPLHCFRKHISGAGIHAQEVLEKAIRHGIVDKTTILKHIKIIKSVPVVLENYVLKVDTGELTVDQYVDVLLELTDTIRGLRQEALSWIPQVRMSAGKSLEVHHKDFIQEIAEYAGELWQSEKHLMEYIADFLLKNKEKS